MNAIKKINELTKATIAAVQYISTPNRDKEYDKGLKFYTEKAEGVIQKGSDFIYIDYEDSVVLRNVLNKYIDAINSVKI